MKNMDWLNKITEENFVNSFTGGNDGTNYNASFVNAVQFFGTNPSNGNRRDTMVFITDGEPNPLTSVNDAVTTAHDMINRTGQFAESSGNSVDIYAINVDLSNSLLTIILP